MLKLLPVGVGDDLGLGDRLRLWRRSGRGSPQRRGLGPRPPPALEHQEQSEYNHYDQGAVEEGLDWFLVVDAACARATVVGGSRSEVSRGVVGDSLEWGVSGAGASLIDARDSLTSTSYVFLK